MNFYFLFFIFIFFFFYSAVKLKNYISFDFIYNKILKKKNNYKKKKEKKYARATEIRKYYKSE